MAAIFAVLAIINCPTFNSGLRRIFREKWYQLDAPRHLYQFTPETLGSMLKKCGFEVKDINYMPFPLHSMVWFKVTMFRWLGLKRFLYSHVSVKENRDKPKNKGIIWILLRNSFNLICRIFAIALGLLRLGDDMCITVEKIKAQ